MFALEAGLCKFLGAGLTRAARYGYGGGSLQGYAADSSRSKLPVVKKWFSAFSHACMTF